jgi:hypothetical protein
MTPKKTITIEDPELLQQAQRIASDAGLTVDDLATEGLKREVGRRTLEKLSPRTSTRRGKMSDQEVETVVEQAVHEARGR